jgi:hypothetical protein
VLVRIDYSVSFDAKRPDAIRALVDGLNQTFAPECICFAGSAAFMPWPLVIPTSTQPNLESGTAWPPLQTAIAEAASKYKIRTIVLLTDGAFGVPIKTILETIRNETRAAVSLIKP